MTRHYFLDILILKKSKVYLNDFFITLFVTNNPSCFQSIVAVERRISGFSKMVDTTLYFYKLQKPNIIHIESTSTFKIISRRYE